MPDQSLASILASASASVPTGSALLTATLDLALPGAVRFGAVLPSAVVGTGGTTTAETGHIYTASGPLIVSDSLAVVNATTAVVMTLAAGTSDWHAITVSRYGAGSVTVSATINGGPGQIVMGAAVGGETCTLRWSATLSSWVRIFAQSTSSTESPDGATLTDATGTLVDRAGITWTMVGSVANGFQLARGGIVDINTGSVILTLKFGGVIYHENTIFNWYVWNGTGYTPTVDPSVTVAVTPAPGTAGIAINLAALGAVVKATVWGMSTSQMDPNSTNTYSAATVPAYQAAVKSLNLSLMRHNWVGFTMDRIFLSRGAAPNWAWIDPFLDNMPSMFSGQLVVTLGNPPAWLDRTLGSDQTLFGTQCAQVAARFALKGRTCLLWEPFNELDTTAMGTLIALFNAARTALRAQNPANLLIGPTDSYLQTGRITSFCAGSLPDYLSWHSYATGNADGPFDTPTIMAHAISYASQAADARTAAGRDLPVFLGEYNINFDYAPGDARQLTNIGAVYNLLYLSSAIKTNARVELGAIWELNFDSNFGVVRTDYSILPVGRAYARAVTVMPGQLASVTLGAGVTNVDVLATKTIQGNGFGVQLLNYDVSAAKTVAITGLGAAASISYFEVSAANPQGVSRTLTQSQLAGLVLPAMSAIFLS